MNRRNFISMGSLGLGAGMVLPGKTESPITEFVFCLNTSTIRENGGSLPEKIKTASSAGYGAVELWVREVEEYLQGGGTAAELRKLLSGSGLVVANAIGFAPWMHPDETLRQQAFEQMKREMELMASLGCTRIAAPPAGLAAGSNINYFEAGKWYTALIELGKQTGVMPQLEFWGSSGTLFHFSQALMIAAISGSRDARILPDVYHMFRGGSDFNILNMLDGRMIEVFHMNDFPADLPREEQKDKDRVFPGDGAAPWSQIIASLKAYGGRKILSVELFNEAYWKLDPLEASKTALRKLKSLI